MAIDDNETYTVEITARTIRENFDLAVLVEIFKDDDHNILDDIDSDDIATWVTNNTGIFDNDEAQTIIEELGGEDPDLVIDFVVYKQADNIDTGQIEQLLRNEDFLNRLAEVLRDNDDLNDELKAKIGGDEEPGEASADEDHVDVEVEVRKLEPQPPWSIMTDDYKSGGMFDSITPKRR